MKRREFLTTAAGAALLASGTLPRFAPQPCAQAAGAPPRRPNFLFIYTDDQRWDAMGVVQREQGDKGRFPWLKTPNMDRVANEGVRFRNAFVVNSLCAPSRACFLTSLYSHLNGVANNHTPFPVDNVTHATLLRQAGYKTGYFGKWHMGGQSGQRPGFDVSASFVGQGQYLNCPIEVNGIKTPSTGWVDDVTTDYALKFIEENKDQPFSMVVGLKAVHDPRTPPEREKELYTGDAAKPPVNATPPAIYRVHPALQADPATQLNPAARADNARPRKMAAPGRQLDYFRCINGADDNIGRLLKALDDHKLADDTVVIFSSDNGYYMGEHGLGDKRSAYDESLRIPFLLRYPRLAKAGTTCDRMVLNIDLAPTLLDLAGAPVPAAMQGRSLKPLLAGKPEGWRTAFFYEYFFERGFATPTTLAVRTDDAKLIKYPGHDEWAELFDLKADPYEMKNLAREPGAGELLRRMQAEFDKQAAAVKFRVPDYADTPGPGAMLPKAGKKKKGQGKGQGKKKGKAAPAAGA